MEQPDARFQLPVKKAPRWLETDGRPGPSLALSIFGQPNGAAPDPRLGKNGGEEGLEYFREVVRDTNVDQKPPHFSSDW